MEEVKSEKTGRLSDEPTKEEPTDNMKHQEEEGRNSENGVEGGGLQAKSYGQFCQFWTVITPLNHQCHWKTLG